jgi:hypothetical protein
VNHEPPKTELRVLIFALVLVATVLTLAAWLNASDALVSAVLLGTAALLAALRPKSRR